MSVSSRGSKLFRVDNDGFHPALINALKNLNKKNNAELTFFSNSTKIYFLVCLAFQDIKKTGKLFGLEK